MDKKKCFKCNRELPLIAFYKHPRMGDGFLNKCKDCTKKDSKERYSILSKDESWMEKERERGRDKFKRLVYKGRFKSTSSICPNAGNISKKLRLLGFSTNGKEAHHWNYNKPNSVFLISRKAHKRIHNFMTVNRDDKYCYTIDGDKIETPDMAKSYFSEILKAQGIEEPLILINF